MGRYAQRRRAATTVAPYVPPPSLSIVSVTVTGGNTATITFSATADFAVGSGAFTGMTIQGLNITDVFNTPTPPAGTALVGIFGATLNPGDAWAVTAQPSWMIDLLANGSGVCV